MKKMKKGILTVLMAGIMAFSFGMMAACGDDSGSTSSDSGDTSTSTSTETAVDSIEVTTMPTKTEYYVDDEFSVEGGVLTVTYSDGTTAEVDMTDEDVTVTEPNMSTAGTKTITVRYGDASTRFTITVSKEEMTVTFDYNYDSITESVTVDKGDTVAKPDEPTRDDYEFLGWYTDSACTLEYDFDTEVTESFTLYAGWISTAVASYTVTYYLNWGSYALSSQMSTYGTYASVKVEEGGYASKPGTDPEREGYSFDGWYTAKSDGEEFDFENTAITADTALYAQWTKTATGTNTYTFEAENLDLTGLTGPGLSGTASEGGMLVSDTTGTASGGVYLSYLYKYGIAVTFYLVCDVAVSDVTFVARMSMENRDYTFNQDNLSIVVTAGSSSQTPEYEVEFTDVPTTSSGSTSSGCLDFEDYEIGTNLSLRAGRNSITFTINNSDALEGTTMTAAGPLLDCIKLSSEGVIVWDATYDLPMTWL